MTINNFNLFKDQIKEYQKRHPLYVTLCENIKKILERILKECVSEDYYTLQSRIKSLSSFAEKTMRPDKNYLDSVNEITDFCGFRIILADLNKVELMNQQIRQNFFIDLENSKNKSDLLNPQEFGYISTHFIIQLLSVDHYEKKYNLIIPDYLIGLKAEIQVKTILQHGWAINQYEKLYKNEFDIPEIYQRELSQAAALLEIADNSLTSISKKLQDYKSNYPAYMSKEEISEEISRLKFIFNIENNNVDLAQRIAKMGIIIEEWDMAIDVLNKVLEKKNLLFIPIIKEAVILKDLGFALQKKNRDLYKESLDKINDNDFHQNPLVSEAITGFEKGKKYLEESVKINPEDSDALSSLGGLWKDIDNDKARNYYKKALNIDPNDPYPLGNYIVMKIQKNLEKHIKNYINVIKRKKEALKRGIEKREKQIEVKVDIPWAYFDVGLFSLFLGKKEKAINNYLKGIKYCHETWMIETALKTINAIKEAQDRLPGLKDVRILLTLVLAFRLRNNVDKILEYNKLIEDLESLDLHVIDETLSNRVTIIAGGTDSSIEKNIELYRQNLIKAFKDYEGVIISGGTPAGVSRIAGNIQVAYPKNVKTIGYMPVHNPWGIQMDDNYNTIHHTNGNDFSILEAFHYWYDILRSDINANDVKLIGINGGKISAFEFRLAIVLNAQVCILKESGRAALELIGETEWFKEIKRTKNQQPIRLFKLINNTEPEIYNFLIKKFIIDPDIDNIRKFFITLRHGGSCIYQKDFIKQDFDTNILSGYLEALDMIAGEINIGDIISINTHNGYFTGGLLPSNNFKIVFLLFDHPSKLLENKIKKVINEIDNELGAHFYRYNMNGHVFNDHKKIAKILNNAFGTEILKFFEGIELNDEEN